MYSSHIRTETIDEKEAWGESPSSQVANSFKNGYVPARLFGPARFVRLLYGGGVGAEGFSKNPSNVYGCFWINEEDLLHIRDALRNDLSNQESAGKAVSMNRMGFALRHELRQMLAICRDWTPTFDFVARLAVPRDGSVVGLVGGAKGQHVYSSEFPDYQSAIADDTDLSGGLMQYVMRFDIPANQPASHWIQSDLNFDLFYG
jgi:hypothetical protein